MFSLQTAVLDTDDGAVIVLKHTSTLGTSKIHHFGFNIKKRNFCNHDLFTKNVIAILISIGNLSTGEGCKMMRNRF